MPRATYPHSPTVSQNLENLDQNCRWKKKMISKINTKNKEKRERERRKPKGIETESEI